MRSKKIKKIETKAKHQSQVPLGFFVYKAIIARHAHINPTVSAEHVDEDLKEDLREMIAQNKDFCEKYCNRDSWADLVDEPPCLLYQAKKKLNEVHSSKNNKNGKYKCKIH